MIAVSRVPPNDWDCAVKSAARDSTVSMSVKATVYFGQSSEKQQISVAMP